MSVLLQPFLIAKLSNNLTSVQRHPTATEEHCHSLDSFEMSIRVDLVIGQKGGGDNKVTETVAVEEKVQVEEETGSEADSGVDLGQEDQQVEAQVKNKTDYLEH